MCWRFAQFSSNQLLYRMTKEKYDKLELIFKVKLKGKIQ